MFLWAVMVFGFSAGELFLLVDEKKIKRRFISPAEAFPPSLDAGACPRGPLCGPFGKERVANVFPVSGQNLFPHRVYLLSESHLRLRPSLLEVLSGLMTTHGLGR